MSYKLDIAMIVPGMAMDWNTMDKQSLGGSETAGLSMAKALVKQGHNVILFCNTKNPGKQADGVNYMPLEQFPMFVTTTPTDVVIAQRMPEIFAAGMASKLNILWCHDLAMLRSSDRFKSVLWNVDKVMTVSKYMTDQYKEVYGLPDETFWTTRNGIDLELIEKVRNNTARHSKQLVYASRPERGLDVLLERIMPKLWEKDKDIKLKICGYDNTTPEMQPFHDYLHGLIKQSEGKAEWVGSLTKEQLYKLYAECTTYVYPTPSPRDKGFAEVSCITAMECQALGLPFISSNRGALSETLHPDAGILLDGDPWTDEYVDKFVEAVLSVWNDGEKRNSMACAGIEAAKSLSWDALATEWAEEMSALITKSNDSPYRLAKHFINHSDIIAAEKVRDEIKIPIDLRDYAFVDSPEAFTQHYKELGAITHERLSKGAWQVEHFEQSNEKRFALIEECIKASSKPIESILDYGTGHGWMTVYLERRIGKRWTGVDVDPGAVKWSRFFADKFAKNPENMAFYEMDKFNDSERYDCLVMTEVLEHCIDPVAKAEEMEKYVKLGGMVIITVPYGPREYPDYKNLKYRTHIHEIDFHSLREIFGQKPGIEIMGVYETMIGELGEPAGFYFLRYKADHKPLGKIDCERKLKLQRPKQTVSVSMIVGPNAEETLHWCLKSVEPIADEAILADCGMSEEAKRIALSYPFVKIVEGADPKIVGFDEARNLGLKHCQGDWILWIDSDEKLIGAEKLQKYFRNNMFNGYSLKQHHFACDTTFKPDLPVRLFRNKAKDGKSMKFFGSVHEHPEFAVNEGPGSVIVISDVHIAHVGYLIEDGRKKRFGRNAPLLEMSTKKYPDRTLNKYFVMRDNMLLCNYELQQNRGQMTGTIQQRCNDTINLFREYFLGKGVYLNTDALDYYSQACSLLNLGTEVDLCVSNGGGQPEIKRIRFANTEDLQKEVGWRAKEVMGKYDHKWY